MFVTGTIYHEPSIAVTTWRSRRVTGADRRILLEVHGERTEPSNLSVRRTRLAHCRLFLSSLSAWIDAAVHRA